MTGSFGELLSKNSAKSFPNRAGWSMTRSKSGARSATSPPRRSPPPPLPPRKSPPSASPTSARRHCSGNGPPGGRWRTRSCGRTDEPRPDVTLCDRPGTAKNTYGTGCFLLMNTGGEAAASRHRLLSTVAWQRGGRTSYALEGSVFIAGAAIQWLRDGLGIIERAADIEALAASVPDTGGVYFVPALSGLGAPYWDPHARGTLLGITRGTTKAHIARAALEAIAFQSAELIEAMAADSGIALTELRVDGGATANNLLMQTQANLLGVPVVRPRVTETTALGAAYLAGLAVGFWKDEAEIAALWSRERVFDPQLSRDAAGARLAEWKRAVGRSRDWASETRG